MHCGGIDGDRKDATALHITFRPQLSEHRQCGLSICTFHLGFSLGYIAQDGFARFMVYPAGCRMAHRPTKGVLSTEFHYDTMLTAHYGRYPSFVCLHTAVTGQRLQRWIRKISLDRLTGPQTKPVEPHIAFKHAYFNYRGLKPGRQLRLRGNNGLVGGRPTVPRCNDLMNSIAEGDGEDAPGKLKVISVSGEPGQLLQQITAKGSGIVPVNKAPWGGQVGPLPFLSIAHLAYQRH